MKIRVKYILSMLIILSITSSLHFSCSSHPKGSSLPKWVLDTPIGCGMGSLQHQGSLALAKTGAIARGRDVLSRQLQTKVESIIKSYRSEGGMDKGDLSEELMLDISQQSSRALLQGTRAQKTYITQTEPPTLYTLVCYEPTQLPSLVKKLDLVPKKHRRAIKARAEAAFAELESLMQGYD